MTKPRTVAFEGILTLVDEPSDMAPAGARGHLVVLTREAAEKALSSLVGTSVGYLPSWDGHDVQRKIGLFTEAILDRKRLIVRGHLYAAEFPDVVKAIEDHGDLLGMSYEVSDGHVEDMRSDVWKLMRVTFTGAAVLLREKAAYRKTSFRVTRSEKP